MLSIVRSNRLCASVLWALITAWPLAGAPRLHYVVIVSRHGVRAPTWDTERLNQYSAEPWPEWGVPPGSLTPHGWELTRLMGAYYRDWLTGEHLIRRDGCLDARHVYIRADKDQRTLETGRALAESLLPGCELAVHAQTYGESDPLFSGAGTPDPERMLAAVRDRLGPDPQKLIADHRTAVDALQFILGGKPEAPASLGASLKGKSIELTGPFTTGSTFSENLLLEYANGIEGTALGWGRLTRENLDSILELHSVYADLMRRTPYLARARGSNLLAHVLHSMEQAVLRKPVAGALGQPGDLLLILSGHDTNLSNLSGMLDLSWKLPGYQPDDTPPGGALIFSLWRDPATGRFSVNLRYLAQTLDQMRNATPLSVTAPPASQDVPMPGCGAAQRDKACPWETARFVMERAIDPQFTLMEPIPAPVAAR
jgi:4-phytase / acid phosphatase